MRALFRFVESRLGYGELLRQVATGKHPPQGTSWLHTLGYAALAIFILQAITGLALAFFYVPAADHAYDSLRYMERDIGGAAFLRALHHWGASAVVVLVFIHALRVYFTGSYKRPREFTWVFGLGLLGVSIGFAFTGYLLPWDQKAYFATKVGVNIAGKTPLIGEHLRSVLYGGEDIGAQTLSRFFALHVLVLPGALLLMLVLHLHQVQRHGVTPLGRPVHDPGVPGRPYHPYHTLKEALVALLVVGIVAALAWRLGAHLEAEADAADFSYDPRPDWYFFAPFQLLKLFKGDNEAFATFWIPLVLGGVLVLLPFLDRNPERSLRRRPIATAAGVVFTLAAIGLTVWGATDRPTHYRTPPHPLGASPELRQGYDLVRREGCLSCHTLTRAPGDVYGRTTRELDAPDLTEIEYEASDLADFLQDTGSDKMPSFPHLDARERLAIGRYLETLRKPAR